MKNYGAKQVIRVKIDWAAVAAMVDEKRIEELHAATMAAEEAAYRQRVSAALDAGVDYCGEVEVRWTE